MPLSCCIICVCLLGGSFAELATEYKQLLLNLHNDVRRNQTSSDMNKLVWDDYLAELADDWVSKCAFAHVDGERFGVNTALTIGRDDNEENIKKVMRLWNSEENEFNYENKGCADSCHFTQIVWAKTQKLGCAIKSCSTLKMYISTLEDGWLIGCWYYRQGNIYNEHPFLKGAPCSECTEGQSCDDGLCVG